MNSTGINNIADIYRLSPVQEGMLFHTLYASDSEIYCEQFVRTLPEIVDVRLLEKAWQNVINRHAILRTSFHWEGLEKAKQVVHRNVEIKINRVNFNTFSEKERELKFEEFLSQDRKQGFNLLKPPLMHLHLISMDGKNIFVHTYHHILMDGWSYYLVFNEALSIYTSLKDGQEIKLNPALPYRAYINWLERQNMVKAENFWRQQLRGFYNPISLPCEKSISTNGHKPEYDRFEVVIVKEEADKLRAFARQNRLTFNTLIQSAWALLLSRYAQSPDILYGIVVSGRTPQLTDVDSMVGLFINTLPLRLQIQKDKSLLDWMHSNQKKVLELMAFDYSPPVEIRNWSEVPKSMPLFSSILAVETYPVNNYGQEFAQQQDLQVFQTTNYPLTLTIIPESSIILRITYEKQRFEAEGIKRMMLHYRHILNNIPCKASDRVKDFPMMLPQEQQQVIRVWNNTLADFPEDLCIHEYFEAQARNTPEAVAASCEGQSLTYKELNEKANQLAHYLREKGVGPEVPVGIFMERSLELITALLAVLKAGGAYIPLDTSYPQKRLQYILESAKPALLLTREDISRNLENSNPVVICLNQLSEVLEEYPITNPKSRVRPDNMMYIIYTSGSTGRPKGVVNIHRSLSNRLHWMQKTYGLSSDDAVLQKTVCSFDVSVWEFFWPLMFGARLVFARPGGHKDPAYLVRLILDENITTVHFVPSMLQTFLQEESLEKLVSLRRVICSGEALSKDLKNRFFSKLQSELHNLYGPTEAAIDVTAWPCLPESAKVPIGCPIDNTRIYILDEEFRPTPIGVAGELCIAGVNLARGYYHAPDLTAEKFVPDPFDTEGGARLYRTGDLACWQEDGNIEYIGRMDFQVKIRGFRIELGEIEETLLSYNGIREACVKAREDVPGDKRLVAYLVPDKNKQLESAFSTKHPTPCQEVAVKRLFQKSQLNLDEVRSYLKKSLPEYMVPAAFVVLEEMPLSLNGKIDLKALPAPEWKSEKTFIEPNTETQIRLAAFWKKILKTEQIGLLDNFFEIGGHSLLATQLLSRIRTEFKIPLPLTAIFEHPVLGELAKQIESMQRAGASPENALIKPLPRDGHLPLSFSQKRLWFIDHLIPGNPVYNIPMVMRIYGELDRLNLAQAINALAKRHESLRTTFSGGADQAVQIIQKDLKIYLDFEDISVLYEANENDMIESRIREYSRKPFDLMKGPLFSCGLLKLAPKEHIFMVSMHHIISDGWSTGIFIKELFQFYRAFHEQNPSFALDPLPIQYADYAGWQQTWVQTSDYQKQMDYWKRKLKDELPVLELPHDKPRPAEMNFSGAISFLTVPVDLTRKLKDLAQRENATLFMFLLTAFKVLLHRYTQQTDIIVGTPIANRNRTETEALIGFFVNTLVLRSDLKGDPEFIEMLRQVRSTTLDAYANQDTPFEKLVDELQPERDLSRNPLFQVVFSLQNTPEPEIKVPGLHGLLIQGETGVAHFDLNVNFEEKDEELLGKFEYSTEIFELDTIKRFQEHFLNLLTEIADDPVKPIGSYSVLSEAEKNKLINVWSMQRTDYPHERCVHELFEEQVQQHPDKIALECGQNKLTYSELNKQANQLANYLRGLGIGPETHVGLCLERSDLMIMAILGILKAGGIYVPVDPTYPKERICFMLQDTQSPVVLLLEKHAKKINLDKVRKVFLDKDQEDIARASCHNPEQLSFPGQLAYVMFTSGSTGKPKGVGVTHRGINRLLFNTNYIDLNSRDVLAHISNSSFDASTLEIWGALLHGGCLVVFSENIALSPGELKNALKEKAITVLWLTAALFKQLVEEIPGAFSGLRYLFTGGEVVDPTAAKKLLSTNPPENLVNGYGPTESTTFTTCYPIKRIRDVKQPIPIGYPIANTSCYIVDKNLRPVPIGVTGELCISGDGLARGYSNRPDLTAEKFVPNPFSKEPGSRMYRTNDLVRWRNDGSIEFVGRADHQVKIRGFRVELGEIETALLSLKGITGAAVIMHEDKPGEKRLAGYLVSEAGSRITVEEVRRKLKENLPEYMVPQAFMFLEKLPINENGKLDRKALPAPKYEQAKFSAPNTKIEKILAGIWKEVLGIEQVGLQDNFFALGGDSILTIQVAARAREKGIGISTKQIFEHQTISALAAEAKAVKNIYAEQGLVTGGNELLPVLSWFFEQQLLNSNHFNQAALIEVPEHLQPETIESALKSLQMHHDIFRLRFNHEKENIKAFYADSEEGGVFEYQDISKLSQKEQYGKIKAIAIRAQTGLDIQYGPIFRVVLFDRGKGHSKLLFWVIHHLAVDGVSWRILMDDFRKACEQITANLPVDLSPKTTSYQYWAQRLNAYAKSAELDQEADYWIAETQNDFIHIPRDFDWNSNKETFHQVVEAALTEHETKQLLTNVNEAYNTKTNEVLLAALSLTFSNWMKSGNILLNMESHGREELFPEVDLNRTMGWFTALYPLRLPLFKDHDYAKCLKTIKEKMRNVPKNGLGYGLLRYSGSEAIKAMLKNSPQAEISFNYLGQFEKNLSTPDVPETELIGPSISSQNQHAHLIDINCMIVNGRFSAEWCYNGKIHRKETIQEVAGQFIQNLRDLAGFCMHPENRGYTVSDFPLLRIDQKQLDDITGEDHRIEDIYPLSPTQKGILFHYQYNQAANDYFVRYHFRIKAKLDIAAFQRAWQTVLERHEALRASFVWKNVDEPLQIIRKDVKLPFAVLDWRDYPEDFQQESMQRLLEQDQQTGFDLSCAPVMRMSVILTKIREYQFIWSLNHILLDGWCVPVILKEVFTCYRSYCEQTELNLPNAPAYSNFIAYLQKQESSKAQDFWQKEFRGVSAPSLLAGKKLPDESLPPGEQGTEEINIPPDNMRKLSGFARQHQITLNVIMQGALAVLMKYYTQEQDIIFGNVVSGRPAELKGIETMVGLFINTLPLRIHINPDQALIPWLKNIQAKSARLRQFEYSSLTDIQTLSGIPRNLPMFDTIMAFENYPMDKMLKEKHPDFDIEVLMPRQSTNYPLAVTITPGEELNIKFEYQKRYFQQAEMRQMLEGLRNIIIQITEKPEARLGNLSLLIQEDYSKIIHVWNQTTAAYPADKCVHELFEEQVRRSPAAIALEFPNTSLTYSELNQEANRIARHLKKLGIQTEDHVGICLERSPEMISGILGILKTGGIYLPLDPEYPEERLNFMLKDSSAPVVLTLEKYGHIFKNSQSQKVFLDKNLDSINTQTPDDLLPVTSADNLAYVIYTSGSTGVPKGVSITHRAINRLLFNTSYIKLNASVRMAHLSNVAFDAATFEIWGALLFGGVLIGIEKETVLKIREFAQLLKSKNINTMFLTTALFNQMAAEDPSAFQFLDYVLFGGEAVDPQWVRQVLQHQPPKHLLHVYGPTETTTFATWQEVSHAEEATGTIPIGDPISNTTCYVLDENMHPMPPGVAGELFIGGDGLARGYSRRPDLTAARFVPDPFSPAGGERLYRSGDLVKRQADGKIVFVGRVDHQVKIRGFRIEPGEIEAAILKHKAILHALVIVREDSPGNKRLVAYVVCREGKTLASHELTTALKAVLPDYMIPASIVILPEFPLNSNGKIDRKALPCPEEDSIRKYIQPKTKMEKQLAEIWSDLLGVNKISRTDNFFELGGHSLLATQLVSRIYQVLKVDLPLQLIFEKPVFQDLALMMDVLLSSHDVCKDKKIKKVPRQNGCTLSFAQQRLWIIDQWEPGNPVYNIPVAVRIQGELDDVKLEEYLNILATRHESLRTVFRLDGDDPVQVILPELKLTLEKIDLNPIPAFEREQEAMRLVKQASRHTFDLSCGPLLRCHLFKLDQNDQILLINMHHICSDGWSIGVLVRELMALYEADKHQQNRPGLPELPVQYADYAAWQREWLQGEVLNIQMNYWKERLKGDLPILEMPLDYPRPQVQTFQGKTVQFSVSSQLSEKLKVLSRKSGATLFMTMLAAFKVLLHKYTNQNDIIIGTPIANRNHPEIEGLIGFFVNTLALRSDLSCDPEFTQLLEQVKENTLSAYEHQNLPFEKIVEILQPQRELNRSPIFQIMFALQNIPIPEINTPELKVKQYWVDVGAAHFDLSLMLNECPEGIQGLLEYNTDLFRPESVEQLGEDYIKLLEIIVSNPYRKISEMELAQKDPVKSWNRTQTDYPASLCVHQIFEARAEQIPAAVALTCEDENIPYSELNRRANQVAHYLRSLGIKPEMYVGICMHRSLEMISGILGILKAGGIYVPIDPSYPKERIRFMLADTQAAAVITLSRYQALMPDYAGLKVLLDDDWEKISTLSDKNPINLSLPENTAYVMFTSGSTGVPKGAEIHHQGINRLVLNTNYLNLTANDSIAHISNSSFDASTWEIWGALLNGGRLVIFPENIALQPDFGQNLKQSRITAMLLTAALFREWAFENPEVFSSLDYLLTGGDVVDPLAARRIIKANPHLKILNCYGPTEATVIASAHLIQNISEDCVSLPIGKPISNTTCHILDEQGRPVSTGVAGELYIGGDGVARGYCKRADLTAEKFIPDPYGSRPGARLYRSGDLVRWQEDGTLEFIGRSDNQVKIRGFRVELAEIESNILSHPQIRNAAVIVEGSSSEDKQLIAFIVLEPKAKLDHKVLKAFIKAYLPEHMHPSFFIFLKELPLTPNGKIDRKALAALAELEKNKISKAKSKSTQIGLENSPLQQTNPVEEKIIQIWSELLNHSSIGIHDNFFEMGGHSLLGIKLITRLGKAFQIKLNPHLILEAPTVYEQAKAIQAQQGLNRQERMSRTPLTALQKKGKAEPIFWIHPMDGGIMCYQHLANCFSESHPFYAIEAPARINPQHSFKGIEDMASCYLSLIKQVQPAGHYVLGGWSFGGIVAFEIARLLNRDFQETSQLIMFDSHAPVALQGDIPRMSLKSMAVTFSGLSQDKKLSLGKLAKLDEEGLLDYIKLLLQSSERYNLDLQGEEIKPFIDIYLAHLQALVSYRPSVISQPILMFKAKTGSSEMFFKPWLKQCLLAESMSPKFGIMKYLWYFGNGKRAKIVHQNNDQKLGWSNYTTAEVRVIEIEGTHEEMIDIPAVQKAAALIEKELAGRALACA